MAGKKAKRNILITVLLIVLPVAAALICLGIGRIMYTPGETVRNVWSVITAGRDSIEKNVYSVLFNMRLPRIILAVLCGSGMALAGCAFQSLFSNVMATPDTLGVAAGASFGAVLAILFDAGLILVQASALVMGVAAVLLTMTFSIKREGSSTVMIILSGIICSSLFQALTSLVKYVADTDSKLPAITYWLLGSLVNANYRSLALGGPFIILGILIIFLLRWKLNILILPEDEIRSLGNNLKLLRILIIGSATMITASCISMCGQIGWVGLLVPHICRMLTGGDHRRLVPACISFGAVFMLIIDTIARAATAAEIPISILTAIIGAPIFVILLRRTGGSMR